MNAYALYLASQAQSIPGFVIVDQLKEDVRQMTIYQSGDQLIVGFGQTEGPIWPLSFDWGLDLNCLKQLVFVAERREKAERGFEVEYQSFKPRIWAAMAKYNPRIIGIGGISKGGGHGGLLANDLIFEAPNVDFDGVVEGTPRPLSQLDADAFNVALAKRPSCRFLRLYRPGDPVEHLPFKVQGYGHLGASETLKNTNVRWWWKFWPWCWGLIHNMAEYGSDVKASGL